MGKGKEPENETAIALREPAAMAAYTPANYTEALAMATVLAKAANISPEEAFLKMATGAEFGIPATTAMRQIDVISVPGKPKQIGLRAQLMVSLCLRAKRICEYFRYIEGDGEKCTFVAKRVGDVEEQRETYTIAQARQAGLVKDGGAWKSDPASMLIARASSRLARRVFPDILGNVYTADELEEARAASLGVPAPVSQLPGAAPTTVHDAEIVEHKESDESRIVRQLGEAQTGAAINALASEALRIWTTQRPETARAAHSAAKKRIASAATNAVVESAEAESPRMREPGEEG